MIELARGRGRPSAVDLAASLVAARSVNATLRDELRAQRAEAREFATDVRAHAYRIHYAAVAGRVDVALHEAATIAVKADRHLRQRGSAA